MDKYFNNTLVTGSISETNASDTYKIGIRFKETGLDQNSQQNKILSVKVYCKLDESVVRVSATTNDSTMATVVEPNTVLKNIGDSHTFTFNVTEGYEYKSVEGCTGTYNEVDNTLTIDNIATSTTCVVTFAPTTVTFTITSSGNYDTVNSATTGAACYYVRNYYGGYNYTPSTTTFSYTYNGTTYNNCKISGTPTCKYGNPWSSGTSFNCASSLYWGGYGWYDYDGIGAGCSATITCS